MNILKKLPKIDKLILNPIFKELNLTLLTQIARKKIENLRKKILLKEIEDFDNEKLLKNIKYSYDKFFDPSLKPLINATGVILHTNMGRSLISHKILNDASKVICNYSNLEYNQQKGCRSERYQHVKEHFKNLLHVEDVLIVNNNASAVFLILNTFAKNKEVIVSRGELVEIGGNFRIPEVMSQSGAVLHEIGTTNKTKVKDYKNAINENTAILMKVHKSNFSIEGFSEDTPYKNIKELCYTNNLIDYYDLGSGYIPKLPYNLGNDEPSLKEILKDNPALISFSGDKLFGSVQAGIIAGKKELIAKLKENQLLRILRVDKITLSILEETIKAYLKEDYKSIPTLWMLFQDEDSLHVRVSNIQKRVGQTCSVIKSKTFMGGGTLPNREFPTVALHVKGKSTKLERDFRKRNIIGRIENEMFLIDFRSILPESEKQIEETIREITAMNKVD
ncbi:MAG: L-seryl-tRNA(Sec) selenium transferase [Sulfurospirillum sp.]|nr:L-seryl-tRNA(Sec) selenium transferase [Sulfurospirillum sp.]